MSENTTIKCPDCGNNIDVNDILKHQIENSLKQQFLEEKKAILNKQKEKEEQLAKDKSEFEAQKVLETERFEKRLEDQKRIAEKEIHKKIKAKIESDNEGRYNEMREELAEKSEKVKELFKKQAEIEKLKREKEEAKEEAKSEAQKELNALLNEQRKKIQSQADAKNELKVKTLEKQLEDQKKMTSEMKRKQEQGSMQLQGEVLELAMEDWLANQFPLDVVDEIKKGATGADCLQTVNTREQLNCGSIYYESKRTKSFQPVWIEKFKNDIREKGAYIGVLVTEVMPADMNRMGMKDGVWICNFQEFKGLCAVLRQSIVQWSRIKKTQENKGDKMELLYDFLTGTEFKLQMEGIVDGFTRMQTDLQKEKNAMKRIWKQREKQIDKVVNNSIGMYGAIKGIAGSAIQGIPSLELESDLEEENQLSIKE